MNGTKPVLLLKRDVDVGAWVSALKRYMPQLEVRVWPQTGPRAEIDFALLWEPPAELFDDLNRLRVIFSVGAGIDHLLSCSALPRHVPIVRMVEPGLTAGMVEYVLYNVLRFHRSLDRYEDLQRVAHWSVLPQVRAENRSIGIMGLGVIGQAVAGRLLSFGFQVHGWSRTRKSIDGVVSFSGHSELHKFLPMAEILVILLPSTEATVGLVNAGLIAQLPHGAFLVNAGRGDLICEGDLLRALDEDRLAGAALDVFAHEPLEAGHRFWSHPRVRVTPHAASITNADSAAEHVVNNIHRWHRGQPLTHLADVERGY